MGTYSRTYSLSDGTTAYGSQVAFELDALGNSVNNVVDAQIPAGANIADSKLAKIQSANKVASAAVESSNKAGDVPKCTSNYVFQISGVSTLPSVSDIYSNNGYQFTVISATATTLYCSGTGAPGASGTLTRVSGAGDASISFSATVGQLPSLDGSLIVNSGNIVQVVNYKTGAYASGSTAMPFDDTIPQNTEGDQYMSLSITPTNVNNKLKVDVVVCGGDNQNELLFAALFQDANVNALAVAYQYLSTSIKLWSVSFSYFMIAGTVAPTTFKVRVGGPGGYIFYFNGYAGSRTMGGVSASSITITEIKA